MINSGCPPSAITNPLLKSLAAGSATGSPRSKVALKPGHGLLDWVRLGNSGVDLAGTAGQIRRVTRKELCLHNKRDDAWMALRGKVYNVTSYMDFHPGGEDELIRGIGLDATHLFNEVHKWVNFENVLQKCLVGHLVDNVPAFGRPGSFTGSKMMLSFGTENILANRSSSNMTDNGPPPLLSESNGVIQYAVPVPKYDWFQTDAVVDVAVYTKYKGISKDDVVVIKNGKVLKVLCYIKDFVYTVHLEMYRDVDEEFGIKISESTGKVDVLLTKMEPDIRWVSFGRNLSGHNTLIKAVNKETEYITCKLKKKKVVTHDTRLFTIEAPDSVHFPVPAGYHVYIKIGDTVKPYTPVVGILDTATYSNDYGRLIHLFIKIYPKGALTPQMDALGEGDDLEVSLPEGNFSHDILTLATSTASHLVLLGAGTGLSPLVKLMLEALLNKRYVDLLLFNKSEDDIPWLKEFENLSIRNKNFLKINNILSEADDSWPGLRGLVSKDLLDELLPSRELDEKIYVCMCGPSSFTKLCLQLLKELGYQADEFHAFQG